MLNGYLKFGLFVFLIGSVLTGCNDSKTDTPLSDKEISLQDNESQKFKTEDGKVEITLFNIGNFSEETLIKIKEETLNYYNKLQKENIIISPPSNIYVHLHDDQKVSYTNGNSIHLFWINEGIYPLIHELTHVLCGYTEGHLTQEGFAVFMQDAYSDKEVFPNFGVDVHVLKKYLMTQRISIPLETLLSDEKIFNRSKLTKDTYSIRWLGYIESASFTTFLIDQYGIEKFLKIYNRPNLYNEISAVYGKKIDQLEMEWRDFVMENSQNEETIHESLIQEIINHLENNKERLLKTS